MDQVAERLRSLTEDVSRQVKDNREVAIGVGAVIAAAGLCKIFAAGPYKRKPGSLDLGGGSIDRAKIDTTFQEYSESYGKDAGAGITDRKRTTELVRVPRHPCDCWPSPHSTAHCPAETGSCTASLDIVHGMR